VPVRVLIVDDQPVFRRLAREVVERRGYTVVAEAPCAITAMDAVRRFAPDAVLLDIRLGDDNGFEVSSAISRTRTAPDVLLVSECDYRHDRAVAESGARGFVLKSDLAKIDFTEFWPAPVAANGTPRPRIRTSGPRHERPRRPSLPVPSGGRLPLRSP
jgi:CheY-like chemotaxis protein